MWAWRTPACAGRAVPEARASCGGTPPGRRSRRRRRRTPGRSRGAAKVVAFGVVAAAEHEAHGAVRSPQAGQGRLQAFCDEYVGDVAGILAPLKVPEGRGAVQKGRVGHPPRCGVLLLRGCDVLGVGETGVDGAGPHILSDFLRVYHDFGRQPHDGDH